RRHGAGQARERASCGNRVRQTGRETAVVRNAGGAEASGGHCGDSASSDVHTHTRDQRLSDCGATAGDRAAVAVDVQPVRVCLRGREVEDLIDLGDDRVAAVEHAVTVTASENCAEPGAAAERSAAAAIAVAGAGRP